MINVGVIGIGSMGANHVRVYHEMSLEGKVKLVGISDINEKKVYDIAEKYKTKAFTDYKELIKEDLDAVNIVVPTTLHKKVAIDVINRGINTFIEKPITNTLDSANLIINSAKRKKVKLQIGHIERFNSSISKLKELIEKNELGEVVSLSAKRVGPYNPRIRDVGIILDLGAHDIDVITHLYNQRPKSVFTNAGKTIHSKEDRAIIVLNFKNHKSGIVETNWFTPHKTRTLTAVGTKGIAYVDYIEQSLRIYNHEWVKDVKIEKKEPLRLELESFVNCIENNKIPTVTGEDAKQVLEIAIAATKSAKSGKIQYL